MSDNNPGPENARPLGYFPAPTAQSKKAEPVHIDQIMASLLELTHGNGNPNINALWKIAKDIEAIKLNIKYFGYDLAKSLAEALPKSIVDGPKQIELTSKPSTQSDLEADWTRYWSSELKIAHVFHRKIWEFAYALQAMQQFGHIRPGARGLGFGCGEEPLPSYLASKGCSITITDLAPENENAAVWARTEQHASLDKSFRSEFLDRESFDKLVAFQYVDMNAISDHLNDYDFCWSICAFEHLGSIEKGIAFIENAMKTIRSGGLSVHTTEFNFMNHEKTLDNWQTVLFQQKHFEEMAQKLTAAGHKVLPLDFDIGSKPLDRFIDVPPYAYDWEGDLKRQWGADAHHIKLAIDGFAATCFGLIAIKG